MYHFEVSCTTMYRVRYVLVRTSTYHLVLPCTRCTGFQMSKLSVQYIQNRPLHIILHIHLLIVLIYMWNPDFQYMPGISQTYGNVTNMSGIYVVYPRIYHVYP
jgi:hypothetical protein